MEVGVLLHQKRVKAAGGFPSLAGKPRELKAG
jgi:hypothetical protein